MPGYCGGSDVLLHNGFSSSLMILYLFKPWVYHFENVCLWCYRWFYSKGRAEKLGSLYWIPEEDPIKQSEPFCFKWLGFGFGIGWNQQKQNKTCFLVSNERANHLPTMSSTCVHSRIYILCRYTDTDILYIYAHVYWHMISFHEIIVLEFGWNSRGTDWQVGFG